MDTNIIDQLMEKIDEKQNPCVVGLDPDFEHIPEHLFFKKFPTDSGEAFGDINFAFIQFNFKIIEAVADLVPAVKLQMAFYSRSPRLNTAFFGFSPADENRVA